MPSPTDTAKDWGQHLLVSDTLREPWRNKVKDSRRQYLNAHPHRTGPARPAWGDSGIKANIFQASMRNIRAMLKPRTLEAKLFAIDAMGEVSLSITQALINQQARQSRLAKESAKFLQHVLLDGHAFFYVTWGIPHQARAIPGGREDADQPIFQRRGRQGKNVGDGEAILNELRKDFPRFQQGKDHPIAVVKDTMDVLLDPDVTDVLDATWFAIRTWLPKSRIEARVDSKFYRKVSLRGFNSNMLPSSRDRWGDGQFSTNQQDRNRVRTRLRGQAATPVHGVEQDKWEVWEIHDLANGRTMHLVPGMDEFLYDEAMDFQTERPALVDFKTDYIPTSYWTPPDNQQYIDLQKDLDQVINYMRDFVRRHGKQIILVRKGTSPDEIQGVAKADTAEMVEVNDPKDYVPFNQQGLSPDFINLTQMYQNFMSISSGVTPVAQGLPASEGASATEIATMARSLSIRMDDMRIDLDRALEEVLGLYIELNQRFMPQSQVIELFGSDARTFGRSILSIGGKESVAGKFRVQLLVGAAGETKANVERQMNLSWYSLLAASPHSNTRAMDEEMHRAFGKDPEQFMAPENEPDFSTQIAESMAQGGGAMQGAGRSLEERGGAPTVQRDRVRRSGATSESSIAGQANRAA